MLKIDNRVVVRDDPIDNRNEQLVQFDKRKEQQVHPGTFQT